jgi:serine/threonine protein kinase
MYDLGEEEGIHYVTMEYVPGQSLKGMIEMTQQLSVGSTVHTAKQICEGLAEAHRLGVVHRDLRPGNIMIDKEGNARILDFGIARSLDVGEIEGADVLIGTPEYMSPEQLEDREIDHRSDLYSLGVILYEMVTGNLPFRGATALSIAVKHKGEKPEDPRKLNPQLPKDLNDLILKCLKKDKENRYQTAGELLSELSDIETTLLTPAREVPKKKPVKEKVSKVKWKSLFLYGGAVILLGLSIVIIYSLITGRQEPKGAIAVLPLQNISGDPDQEYFADGMTEALITELSRISGFERVIS